ncbi:MAG: vitamin K epoxide reductase family protein [Caldilineaceae bacterium]
MDFINQKPAQARHLSNELRNGVTPALRQRRTVAGLSLLAAGAMGVIALYQLGIIKHLPEPPLPLLNADKVDASVEAYSRFHTPDAFLGVTSYAATAALAAMGDADRAHTMPLIPLALAAKVSFDAFQGIRLSIDQITKQKALCSWCLLAAGVTVAAAPRVWPEAKMALKQLLA